MSSNSVDVKIKAKITDATGETAEGVIVARLHPLNVGWPDQDWGSGSGQSAPIQHDGQSTLEVLEVLETAIVDESNGSGALQA